MRAFLKQVSLGKVHAEIMKREYWFSYHDAHKEAEKTSEQVAREEEIRQIQEEIFGRKIVLEELQSRLARAELKEIKAPERGDGEWASDAKSSYEEKEKSVSYRDYATESFAETMIDQAQNQDQKRSIAEGKIVPCELPQVQENKAKQEIVPCGPETRCEDFYEHGYFYKEKVSEASMFTRKSKLGKKSPAPKETQGDDKEIDDIDRIKESIEAENKAIAGYEKEIRSLQERPYGYSGKAVITAVLVGDQDGSIRELDYKTATWNLFFNAKLRNPVEMVLNFFPMLAELVFTVFAASLVSFDKYMWERYDQSSGLAAIGLAVVGFVASVLNCFIAQPLLIGAGGITYARGMIQGFTHMFTKRGSSPVKSGGKTFFQGLIATMLGGGLVAALMSSISRQPKIPISKPRGESTEYRSDPQAVLAAINGRNCDFHVVSAKKYVETAEMNFRPAVAGLEDLRKEKHLSYDQFEREVKHIMKPVDKAIRLAKEELARAHEVYKCARRKRRPREQRNLPFTEPEMFVDFYKTTRGKLASVIKERKRVEAFIQTCRQEKADECSGRLTLPDVQGVPPALCLPIATDVARCADMVRSACRTAERSLREVKDKGTPYRLAEQKARTIMAPVDEAYDRASKIFEEANIIYLAEMLKEKPGPRCTALDEEGPRYAVLDAAGLRRAVRDEAGLRCAVLDKERLKARSDYAEALKAKTAVETLMKECLKQPDDAKAEASTLRLPISSEITQCVSVIRAECQTAERSLEALRDKAMSYELAEKQAGEIMKPVHEAYEYARKIFDTVSETYMTEMLKERANSETCNQLEQEYTQAKSDRAEALAAKTAVEKLMKQCLQQKKEEWANTCADAAQAQCRTARDALSRLESLGLSYDQVKEEAERIMTPVSSSMAEVDAMYPKLQVKLGEQKEEPRRLEVKECVSEGTEPVPKLRGKIEAVTGKQKELMGRVNGILAKRMRECISPKQGAAKWGAPCFPIASEVTRQARMVRSKCLFAEFHLKALEGEIMLYSLAEHKAQTIMAPVYDAYEDARAIYEETKKIYTMEILKEKKDVAGSPRHQVLYAELKRAHSDCEDAWRNKKAVEETMKECLQKKKTPQAQENAWWNARAEQLAKETKQVSVPQEEQAEQRRRDAWEARRQAKLEKLMSSGVLLFNLPILSVRQQTRVPPSSAAVVPS